MAVPYRCTVAGSAGRFRPWQTVWKRHHRFSFDGTYQRILDAVRDDWADAELDEDVQRLLSVDSTVVRAHQHAAGAPDCG